MARGKKGWVGKYSPSMIRRYRDEHWVLILADPANGIPKSYWHDLLTKAECVAAAAKDAVPGASRAPQPPCKMRPRKMRIFARL